MHFSRVSLESTWFANHRNPTPTWRKKRGAGSYSIMHDNGATLDDTERENQATAPKWSIGKTDLVDWAHPGNQWKN